MQKEGLEHIKLSVTMALTIYLSSILEMNSTAEKTVEIEYPDSIFDLKQDIGADFIENFIKKNDLKPLVDLIKNVVDKTRKTKGRSVIISLCSEKGGVGKSTITIILSQLLANIGLRTYVVDTDYLQSSSKIILNRQKLIYKALSEKQDMGVPIESVIAYKRGLEPIVNCEQVSVDNYSASFIDDIAKTEKYDVVVIDTSGHKSDEAGTFLESKKGAASVAHTTSAYVSDAVIVPMQCTHIDMDAALTYYIALTRFLHKLNFKEPNKNTVAKILPSKLEADSSTLKSLNEFKQDSGASFFDVPVRQSRKIANTTSFNSTDTLFFTNVAKNVLESFYCIAYELFEEIGKNIGGGE